MGFFTGRATFARYRLIGPAPDAFGTDHLERLAEHQVGRQRLAASDGVEAGWIAGGHILDTRFGLAKNVVNDTLFAALRIDQQKLPAELMRAYYQTDLEALSAGNPSGRPSARQKREAKESARDRLEHEAKDGRYLKRKATEVLWERRAHELLLGTTSVTQIDRLFTLVKNTFGLTFEAITAGRHAYRPAELHQLTRNVDDASPKGWVAAAR